MTGDEMQELVAAAQELGSQDAWLRPSGYPDSIALCVIDAVWSLGSHYDRHVVPVLDRYRVLRRDRQQSNPERDTAADLLQAIDAVGGSEAFAAELRNRQRTSTKNGVLKADAVRRAAAVLSEHGVEHPSDLVNTQPPELVAAWRRIPGQKTSKTGWRYVLLLCGAPEVKPDRMVTGWVGHAIGRAVSPEEAHQLVTALAQRLNVDAAALDHRIWREQSGRPRARSAD